MSKILRIIVQDGDNVTAIFEYVGAEKVDAMRAALVRLAEAGPLSDNCQNMSLWETAPFQSHSWRRAQHAYRGFLNAAGWREA